MKHMDQLDNDIFICNNVPCSFTSKEYYYNSIVLTMHVNNGACSVHIIMLTSCENDLML